LKVQGFKIHNVIVNNIIPSFDEDTWKLATSNKAVALLKMQHDAQMPYIQQYDTLTSGENINLVGVSKLPFEPRGSQLNAFSRLLWKERGMAFTPSKSMLIESDDESVIMRLSFPPSKDLELFDDGYSIFGMKYTFEKPLESDGLKVRKSKTQSGATYTYR